MKQRKSMYQEKEESSEEENDEEEDENQDEEDKPMFMLGQSRRSDKRHTISIKKMESLDDNEHTSSSSQIRRSMSKHGENTAMRTGFDSLKDITEPINDNN